MRGHPGGDRTKKGQHPGVLFLKLFSFLPFVLESRRVCPFIF